MKHPFHLHYRSKPITEELAAKIASHCAIAAVKRGYKVFGVMKRGQCWSGPNAHETYANGGVSSSCKSELGSDLAFTSYIFI